MSATDAASPFATADGGVRVALRVRPGARRTAIEGVEALADGRPALKVSLAAPPEGGRANAALVKLLAKAWRLPKGELELVAGARGRTKTLLVRGEPRALTTRLERWLAAQRRGAASVPECSAAPSGAPGAEPAGTLPGPGGGRARRRSRR